MLKKSLATIILILVINTYPKGINGIYKLIDKFNNTSTVNLEYPLIIDLNRKNS